MKFKYLLITALVTLIALLYVYPVAAGSVVSLPTVTLTCGTLTQAGGGSITADRDNTGTGNERFRLEITDGAGTILFVEENETFIGAEIAFNDGTFPFNAASVNPVRYRVSSVAGNALPEQIFLDVVMNVDLAACGGGETPVFGPHLNVGHCDDARVYVYADTDSEGNAFLSVYRSVDADTGTYIYSITEVDLADAPPTENTLLKSAADYDLYLLTSGEFQINTPFDFEGKSCVLVMNGLPPSEIYSYDLRQ